MSANDVFNWINSFWFLGFNGGSWLGFIGFLIGIFIYIFIIKSIIKKKKELNLKWNEPLPKTDLLQRRIKKGFYILGVIAIVFIGGIAIKHFSKYQFNGERRSSSSGSSSYEHSCGHCGEGFNGGGYIGSYPNITKVSSSEIESFPAHYCSKRCAIAD